jgi:hypothetical protein
MLRAASRNGPFRSMCDGFVCRLCSSVGLACLVDIGVGALCWGTAGLFVFVSSRLASPLAVRTSGLVCDRRVVVVDVVDVVNVSRRNKAEEGRLQLWLSRYRVRRGPLFGSSFGRGEGVVRPQDRVMCVSCPLFDPVCLQRTRLT